MTHEEKINYMRIATGIVGIKFYGNDADLLVSLYELVIEKKGETDLDSVCRVESEVKDRANAKKLSQISDKA